MVRMQANDKCPLWYAQYSHISNTVSSARNTRTHTPNVYFLHKDDLLLRLRNHILTGVRPLSAEHIVLPQPTFAHALQRGLTHRDPDAIPHRCTLPQSTHMLPFLCGRHGLPHTSRAGRRHAQLLRQELPDSKCDTGCSGLPVSLHRTPSQRATGPATAR
jgi:hypothetical protein